MRRETPCRSVRGTSFYLWAGAATVAAAVIAASFAIIALSPRPTPLSTPPIVQLSATISTDTFVYYSGEPVKTIFTVRNLGTSTVNLTFSSSCQATFRVVNAGGATVYDDSVHRACFWMVTSLGLPVGANATYASGWDQLSADGTRVPAGAVYRVIARLMNLPPISVPEAVSEFAVWPVPEMIELGFSAATDRSLYTPGEVAYVSVTLTNLGISPVTLHFGDPCFMEFLVYGSGTKALYNSSFYMACIQVIAQVSLEPGGSTTTTFSWNLRADNGTPLPSGQWYEIIPRFSWGASNYQEYVTRTDPVTFYLRP